MYVIFIRCDKRTSNNKHKKTESEWRTVQSSKTKKNYKTILYCACAIEVAYKLQLSYPQLSTVSRSTMTNTAAAIAIWCDRHQLCYQHGRQMTSSPRYHFDFLNDSISPQQQQQQIAVTTSSSLTGSSENNDCSRQPTHKTIPVAMSRPGSTTVTGAVTAVHTDSNKAHR